ncbi:hypothetical protein EHQ58_07565 [Leptospira ognonensis]|uniref:Uncharacterized protein n=1 Tax=Leptospira ognonensis TaxID=2484945 RepID=A0A4R9K596_9LEPT|nr:hypothetical protein [Leptospira ognonensis]TGL60344.1 hypothetical protein EHQ58_07565 [Leptospira ognonensis]
MKSFRFLIFFSFLLNSVFLFAQAPENPSAKDIISQDKMQCYSIPTEIDSLEYQKSVKCVTKDAICFIIQGFAMSCIPRSGKYPLEIPDMTPKPSYP